MIQLNKAVRNLFVLLALAGTAQSASPPHDSKADSKAVDSKAMDDEEVLPDIEAATYKVEVNKRSKSSRVYLFDPKETSQNPKLPKTGKILLLTSEKQNVMAFRIIKQYPARNQFAGSKVRTYGQGENLEPGDRYTAIEKIADLSFPEYSAHDRELDQFDLKELELEMEPIPVPSYDPDLDAGTSPPPGDDPNVVNRSHKRQKIVEEDLEDIEVKDEDVDPLTPDEVKRFDNDWQWVTAQIAYLANVKPSGETSYYTGGGIRYGVTFAKYLFAKKPKIQDSLTAELGLFYYTVLGYETDTDSFRVLPLIATLRYNLLTSESFGFYFYGGFVKNSVLSASSASDYARSRLSSFGPAAGAGLLFRLGPKWFVRADLGIDCLGAGLLLRF